jgi:cell pole-organizing protein PopZ
VLLMGDISTEPSMEEILSSIKRIIAEEGDAATGSRSRRPAAKPSPVAVEPAADPVAFDDDEILELSEPAPEPAQLPRTAAPMPIGAPDVPRGPELLSERAVEATRGPLEALSRMVVKPEVAGSDTLEGMVRDMVRPMLREWLDANLPQIVETMVAREISRITGRQ